MALFDDLSQKLSVHAITPSIQRIKILDYLQHSTSHPTADQIFSDLQKTPQPLSKATVYNTLALFAERGLIRVLPMENNENRYDILSASHGHFICTGCKTVYDVPVDLDGCIADRLEGFEVREKNVFLKGLCPQCLIKKQTF